ncbi:TonB-dependent receptor plug domain-containing protein [Alcanivorax sp. IO_7]|nr:TonB-dependent receptor plug domain-containing protein [Alcanivorax sp. IO_7]
MGDGGTFSSMQIDPYFLERVEIVKGPTSVLYGRASPGGLVNLTSKKPLFETRQEVTFSAGNNNYRGAAFDFAGPLSDGAAYRVVGLTNQGDTQFDHLEHERRAIMPSLTLDLGDNTTLDLMAYFQDDPEGGSHSGVPAEGTLYPATAAISTTSFSRASPPTSSSRAPKNAWLPASPLLQRQLEREAELPLSDQRRGPAAGVQLRLGRQLRSAQPFLFRRRRTARRLHRGQPTAGPVLYRRVAAYPAGGRRLSAP